MNRVLRLVAVAVTLTATAAPGTAQAAGLRADAPASPRTASGTGTVAVDPSCGTGGRVTVTGSGEPPSSYAYVFVNGESVAGRIPVDDTGSWQTVVELGPDGDFHIGTEILDATTGRMRPGPNTFYSAPCTVLTVVPGRLAYRPGAVALHVQGSGYFRSTVPVDLFLAGAPVGTPVTVNDNDGSLDATLNVELPPCGDQVELAGVQRKTPYDRERRASSTLTITCPALVVTPDAVPVASPPADPPATTWAVSGFDPEALVALRLGSRPLGVVRVDGEGAHTAALDLEDVPCGAYDATATQVGTSPSPAASTQVSVTCEVPPVDTALAVSPQVATDGQPVQVTGSGFAPGVAVRLSWLLADGSTAPGGVTVPAGPDGTVRATCLVLGHARLGVRVVVAAQSTPARAASASVLVVPGSLQPGRNGLVTRR